MTPARLAKALTPASRTRLDRVAARRVTVEEARPGLLLMAAEGAAQDRATLKRPGKVVSPPARVARLARARPGTPGPPRRAWMKLARAREAPARAEQVQVV